MRRKIIFGIIILVSALAVYRITKFIVNKLSGETVEETKALPVKAIGVKRMDLAKKLKFSGNIVGIQVVKVFSQVPGKVHSVLVKDGDKVGKGRILFKINRDIVGMDYNLAGVESPITGYVGSITADPGQTINQMTPLAEVVNMSTVEAVVNITEEDINKVKAGMNAQIKVETYPDQVFKGKVYKKSAVLDPVSRSQELRIRIANNDMKLKHGMFGDVEIETEKKGNALVILEDSIAVSEKNKKSVFKVVNDTAVYQEIETGLVVEHYIEVTKGLMEGDVVVTLGFENVQDGDRLKIFREDVDESANTGEKQGEMQEDQENPGEDVQTDAVEKTGKKQKDSKIDVTKEVKVENKEDTAAKVPGSEGSSAEKDGKK